MNLNLKIHCRESQIFARSAPPPSTCKTINYLSSFVLRICKDTKVFIKLLNGYHTCNYCKNSRIKRKSDSVGPPEITNNTIFLYWRKPWYGPSSPEYSTSITCTMHSRSRHKCMLQWRIQNSTWGGSRGPKGRVGRVREGCPLPLVGVRGENFEKMMQNGAV